MLSDTDTDQVLPAEDTSTEPDVIASSKQETLEDVLVPPGPYQQVWDKYLLFGNSETEIPVSLSIKTLKEE